MTIRDPELHVFLFFFWFRSEDGVFLYNPLYKPESLVCVDTDHPFFLSFFLASFLVGGSFF